MGRVSVIIPSRNERYLQATVTDLLAKAAGDIEILVMLEGLPWPDPPLPDDPRVQVHFEATPIGMRPCINKGAALATGEFLMKCDAHCIFDQGWDETLKADCDHDWLVVPTRHSIDAATWTIKPRDFNYTILTYPYLSSMYGAGFHAVTFPWHQNKAINRQRADRPIDDILSAQGSCWFQRTAYFRSFPPLDHDGLYFYQEAQETMGRVWAAGGRCVINKRTHYGHFHKGKDNQGADGRPGRGYYLDVRKKRASESLMTDMLLHNRWPILRRTFLDIIEQHWWLISQMADARYAWPDDWRDFDKHRAWFEHRTPDQIPAHT